MKRIVITILMIAVFTSACVTTNQRSQIRQLTPVQKAELAVKQGKKVEKYYEDVVVMFKAVYDAYKANPTEENLTKLNKMYGVHEKAEKIYNKYRGIHNRLITLLEVYKGREDDELLTDLTSQLTEITRQIVIESIN